MAEPGSDQMLARIKGDAAITLGNYVNFETVTSTSPLTS